MIPGHSAISSLGDFSDKPEQRRSAMAVNKPDIPISQKAGKKSMSRLIELDKSADTTVA